ncbi:MAG: PQQ-binding-like beta-propeller repeat protein [Planctomycetaceae bacterium]|nr:PQQ-binding-like beta-propeller repeat protein [Planctomycetaceae bacterium]
MNLLDRQRRYRGPSRWMFCWCLLFASYLVPPSCLAQGDLPEIFRDRNAGEPSDQADWFQIPIELELTRKLNTTAQLAREERVLEAATALQAVIEHPVDYFTRIGKTRVSARQQLDVWIEQLPAGVLQAYETQSGPKAAYLLKQFSEDQQSRHLVEASRLYLHSQAGSDAAYLLASHLLDRGRYLACLTQLNRLAAIRRFAPRFEPALTLQRAVCLIRLEQPEAARALLQEYFEQQKLQSVTLGGIPLELDELLVLLGQSALDPNVLARADQDRLATPDWPMFRRSVERRRQASGFSPLPRIAWQTNVRESLMPDHLPRRTAVSDLQEYLHRLLRSEQFSVLPAWNPIVVGEHVVVAGFGALAAFSRRDGRLAWKSSTTDDILEYLHSDDLVERYPVYASGEIGELHQYLLQQMVGDLTTGTLSSDGTRVFSVRGNGLVHAPLLGRALQNSTGVPLLAAETNVLAAVDLHSGGLLWEIGGTQGRQAPEFSRHFFLGPPLPAESGLFTLSENGRELFLSELDPATGQPRWMQPLVHPEFSIVDDRPRRLQGASLVSAEPFLIGLTNSGMAVACDTQLRELRWVFVYKEPPAPAEPVLPFRNRRADARSQPPEVDLLNGKHWQESAPVVQDTRVLFTPGDAQDLFCCDLISGELQWTEPRRDGMFIDVTPARTVLIVGKRVVRCLRLRDGEELWSTALPEGGPAGRGIVQRETYHLAMNPSGLLTLDLATGRILAETAVAADARHPLGNLLAAGDQLFALGEDRLIGFEPLAHLSHYLETGLRENPEHANLLLLRGELALHLGQSREGLALLQRAYRAEQSPEIARQLTRTLLSANIADIHFSPEEAQELAQLMVAAEHSTDIVIRYAKALQRLKQPAEALRVLEGVLTSPAHRNQLVAISGERRVRADRLTTGFLLDLLPQLPPAERESVLLHCRELLEQQTDPESLRLLLPLFRAVDLEEAARWRIVRSPASSESPLTLERHLLWLAERSTAESQPEITARLARLYLQLRGWSALSPLLWRLENEFADRLCLENRTGKDLAAEWTKALPVDGFSRARAPLLPADRFAVSVLPEEHALAQADQPRSISLEETALSPWPGWSFELLRSTAELTARDPLNQPRWTALFPEGLPGGGECVLRSEGHLLLVACEGELHGFDTLSAARDKQPARPLWSAEFGQGGAPQQPGFGFVETDAVKVIGPAPLLLSWEREVGQLARCVDHQLVYREESRILVRDALDGQILWELETGQGAEELVWVDQALVYSLDLANQQARQFRLTDGQPGRSFQLPQHDRLLALTREIAVFWRRLNPDEGQLYGFDLARGQIRWQFDTSGSVTLARASEEHLVCIDHATHLLRILEPLREEPIFAALQVPDSRARELFVVADEHRWFVHFTARPETITQPLAFHSLQDIHGPVVAIERKTGQLLWTRQLELLRWIPQQPSGFPFLVYGAIVPVHREDEAGNQQLKFEPRLEVVDKRSGQTISTARAGLEGRLTDIEIELPATGKMPRYRLNFSEGTLMLQPESPADDPS